jgi:hypothetical protein
MEFALFGSYIILIGIFLENLKIICRWSVFMSLPWYKQFPMSPIKLSGALLHRRPQAFPDSFPHAEDEQEIQGFLPANLLRKSRPRWSVSR